MSVVTPASALARRAREAPGDAALLWGRRGRMTFRELDERANEVAARVRAARPAGPCGATATLCATPGPEAVAALFGLWRAGMVAVPLHERLTRAEIDHAVRTVRAEIHLDDELLSQAPAAKWAPFGRTGGLLDDFPDVVAMILTSGSAGAPRAVGFDAGALAASAAAAARRLGLGAGDRWGLCLSMGHIGGLSLVVRAVTTGASVRLWPSFDPDDAARALLDGRLTHLAVVPVMMRRIVASLARMGRPRLPSTARCVLVGGAAAGRRLLDDAWDAGIPVATTWGMTETASQIATAPPDVARRRPGTAGAPLAGVEVRRGPDGVLHVRGPTLAAAVAPGPGEPARSLPLAAAPDGSPGWFATRDLGRVDEDGLVWVEGRADATIVSGGLNVSPARVEQVIASLDGVREALVFGVPDPEWGEIVAAMVEADEEEVTAADVDRHCRAALSRGHCPSRIVVTRALARTWTGKVIRPDPASLTHWQEQAP